MATKTATHGAAAVRQIEKIVVGGTWVANDTIQARMGSASTGYKDLVVTIGDDNSTTQVATSIMNAWNATQRLDSEGETDATSNFGGYEFGEFCDGVAFIDPDATSTVYIKSAIAGVPFTVTFSKTSASGTLTQTTPQAATGPWHWNNINNWDTNTVPVSGADDVMLKDLSGPSIGFKYGLPTADELPIKHYMSYTGPIGLPLINLSTAGKPYIEYRQRYLGLGFSAAASVTHQFGLGKDGPGSPLINILHTGVDCFVIVHNTGQPLVPGTKALNICATDVASTMTILGGSVDFGSQFGSTSQFVTFCQRGGDSQGISAMKASSTVTVSGGTTTLSGTAAWTKLTASGGTVRLQDQSGTISTLEVVGGTVRVVNGPLTISSLQAVSGEFDLREGDGVVTVTLASLALQCRYQDPYSRTSAPTNFKLADDPSPNWVFGISRINGKPLAL